MQELVVAVTAVYLVGIFYRRCYKDVQKYKDKIGYTDDLEYVRKYEQKIKEYSKK